MKSALDDAFTELQLLKIRAQIDAMYETARKMSPQAACIFTFRLQCAVEKLKQWSDRYDKQKTPTDEPTR